MLKSHTVGNGSRFILTTHDRQAIKDPVGKEGKIKIEFLEHPLGSDVLMEESFEDYKEIPLAYASEPELQEMIAKGYQEGIPWVDQSELELEKIIAKGADTCIYLALWKPFECHVVVKTFVPLQQIVLQLQRTIKMLMTLQPQSNAGDEICKIMGISVVNTTPAIVMEQMAGDLRSFINFQTINMNHDDMSMPMLSPYHANIAMMMSIAKGMKDLHSCGLIHRDLKSSNVLLAFKKGWMDSGFIKIADFGIEGAMGTGFWRAPEVLGALKHGVSVVGATLTPKADVYAFAMVCSEILTGHIPFEDHRLSDYNVVLSGQRPALPHGVNDMLRTLLSLCWHHDPEIRPEFVEIVKILENEYAKLLIDNNDAHQQSEEFRTIVEKWSTEGRQVWRCLQNADTEDQLEGKGYEPEDASDGSEYEGSTIL